MTREEFEQLPALRQERFQLERRGEREEAQRLCGLLREAEELARRLPDPKARLIARKVMEYGAPIPWKRIVAELGNRWTVGKARYAYSRVCALCFAPRKRKGECHGLYCKTMPLPWNLPRLREKGERGGLPAGGMSLSDPPAAACGGRDAPPHPGAEPHPRTAAGTSGVKAGVCPPAGPQGRDGLPAEGG